LLFAIGLKTLIAKLTLQLVVKTLYAKESKYININ